MTFEPTSKSGVERLLEESTSTLHPSHRIQFEAIRISPRLVAVDNEPGAFVYVVAEHQGKILYWSDVEEGWEIEQPTRHGGIATRGCNQFELSHLMYQTFGDPNADLA